MSWVEFVSVLGLMMIVLGLSKKFVAAAFGDNEQSQTKRLALIGAGVVVFAVSAYFILRGILEAG